MSAARDGGLQPERTELAWRRTVLTLAAAALVSVRVLPPVLGAGTIAAGLVGVALAGGLWVAAHRRAKRVETAFRGGSPLPGGGLLAATAGLTLVGAALALTAVVVGLSR